MTLKEAREAKKVFRDVKVVRVGKEYAIQEKKGRLTALYFNFYQDPGYTVLW